jgi:hypothetical protein
MTFGLLASYAHLDTGQKPQSDLKAEGARALWDNLDDMILLVSELQEVGHIFDMI